MSDVLKLLRFKGSLGWLLKIAMRIEQEKAAIKSATPGTLLTRVVIVDATLFGRSCRLLLDVQVNK